MEKAKLSLKKAVGDDVAANSGFRAVSAMPALNGGQPEATITLFEGDEIKKVTEKLNGNAARAAR
jgi:hypothetical protein